VSDVRASVYLLTAMGNEIEDKKWNDIGAHIDKLITQFNSMKTNDGKDFFNTALVSANKLKTVVHGRDIDLMNAELERQRAVWQTAYNAYMKRVSMGQFKMVVQAVKDRKSKLIVVRNIEDYEKTIKECTINYKHGDYDAVTKGCSHIREMMENDVKKLTMIEETKRKEDERAIQQDAVRDVLRGRMRGVMANIIECERLGADMNECRHKLELVTSVWEYNRTMEGK